MPTIDADQVTTRQAAEILNRSIRATIRLVETGKLEPLIKLPGLRGAFLFDRKTIEQFRDQERAA